MATAQFRNKIMSDSLEYIAYQNGLELIETTSERNGYPAHLKKAIIGFDTFEEAEKIARENHLSIEIFTKRDGWQLYYRTGNSAFEPFRNSASDYGDDYDEFSSEDIDGFYENEVKSFVEDFDDFDSLSSFIDTKKRVFEELGMIDDDEIVITYEGRYCETIKKTSMRFYHDTKTKVIGLIER